MQFKSKSSDLTSLSCPLEPSSVAAFPDPRGLSGPRHQRHVLAGFVRRKTSHPCVWAFWELSEKGGPLFVQGRPIPSKFSFRTCGSHSTKTFGERERERERECEAGCTGCVCPTPDRAASVAGDATLYYDHREVEQICGGPRSWADDRNAYPCTR